MDEPSLAILDRWSRYARPCLVALAFALLTAFYPAHGRADEKRLISRLPPVIDNGVTPRVVEKAATSPANDNNSASNVAGFGSQPPRRR